VRKEKLAKIDERREDLPGLFNDFRALLTHLFRTRREKKNKKKKKREGLSRKQVASKTP